MKYQKHLSDRWLLVIVFFATVMVLVLIMISVFSSEDIATVPSTSYIEKAEKADETVDTSTAPGYETYTSELGFSLDILEGVELTNFMNEGRNRLAVWEGNGMRFEVRFKNGEGTELENYYYLDFIPESQSTLGGEIANVTKSEIGYCDAGFCGDPFMAYSVKKGNDFVNLVFYGDTKLSDTEKAVLESFKFTK